MDFGVPWVGMGTTGNFKFCKKKGQNLVMNKSKTVARRYTGFSNAVCFSHSALLPWQLFLLEIVDAQGGWSGHLRIGVTQHNPYNMKKVPEMVIPDLVNIGRTWAVAITNYHNRIESESAEIKDTQKDNEMILFANQQFNTEKLYFAGKTKLTFDSNGVRIPDCGQATYIGSRIGIRLIPVAENGKEILAYPLKNHSMHRSTYFSKCNVHLVINGEDQGASIKNIPLNQPLFLVADVYSITTGVEIVSLPKMTTLKDLSRDVITSLIKEPDVVRSLPLPTSLIRFCLFS